MIEMMEPLRLRLPATSANLGPGFDALGLAMRLYLYVEANAASEFRIAATGRDAALVGSLERNLMVETYREVAPDGPALDLAIHNEIPLGMGCGSSAAALLAGVLLANHFGALGWTDEQVVAEACRREGHPDNVAACFYGGLTASAMEAGRVTVATFGHMLPWRLLLALPGEGLATTKARALLPDTYSRADAVANIQATALLVSAFALDRPELLAAGTRDRVHQPYRGAACPLLPNLLPLARRDGIFSVTLSGAGPSVLLIADGNEPLEALERCIRGAAGDFSLEVRETRIAAGVEHTSLVINERLPMS
jgi:homoserine kinase